MKNNINAEMLGIKNFMEEFRLKEIDSENEFNLNNTVYEYLKGQLKLFLQPETDKVIPKLKFIVNRFGNSYTRKDYDSIDGYFMTVSIPQILTEKYNKNTELVFQEALTAHESQHIVSTDFGLFKEIFFDVETRAKKYLEDYYPEKAEIHDAIAQQAGRFAQNLLNILEDGRIERIISDKFSGMKYKLKILNYAMYIENSIPTEGSFQFLMSNIWDFAKLEMFSYDVDFENRKGELKFFLENIAPLILKAKYSNDFKVCYNSTIELYELLQSMFIHHTIENINEMEKYLDLLEKLMESAEGLEASEMVSPQEGEEEKEKNNGNTIPQEALEKLKNLLNLVSKEEKDTDKDQEKDSENNTAGKSDEKKNNEEKDNTETDSKEDAKDDNDNSDKKSDKNSNSNNKSDEKDNTDKSGKESSNSEDGSETQNDTNNERNLKSEFDNIKKELNKTEKQFESFKNIEKLKRRKMEKTAFITSEEKEELLKLYRMEAIDQPELEPETLENEKIKQKSASLKKDIKKIFTNTGRRVYRNLDSGCLDTDSLIDLNFGSKNIFCEEYVTENRDFAVNIMIDFSGSMDSDIERDYKNNRRITVFNKAMECAQIIEYSFEGLPIALQMQGFCTTNRKAKDGNYMGVTLFYPIKTFNQLSAKNKYYSVSSDKNHYPHMCNSDYAAVRLASNQLLRREESKKILIIISDGMPYTFGLELENPSSPEESQKKAMNLTKAEAQNAINNGIEVIPIFIVPNDINSASNIEDSMLFNEIYGDICETIHCSVNNLSKKLSTRLKKIIK